MYSLNLTNFELCTSQIEASTSPSTFARSNAPPISTEIALLKNKFRLQSTTVHAFRTEIYHKDILKTSFKDPFERVIH